MLKEDQMKAFFEENRLPSDTSAIVVSLSFEETLNKVSYYYTFDLSALFTQQLRAEKTTNELNFALIPVSINYNASTGQVTSVKQLQTITATRIRSANSKDNPMNIEIVYSGFKRTR